MLDNLRKDATRMRREAIPAWRSTLEALLFDNGFQAVVLYRLASWFKRNRIPVLGPLTARFNLFLTGADVSHSARIGPGLRISHGVGLVVGGYVEIGGGALLLHGATIGSPSEGRVKEMPVIGERAFIGAGAVLIGAISVGDDVVVGPNAVVTRDVPGGSRVLSTAGIEVTPRTPPPAAPQTSDR